MFSARLSSSKPDVMFIAMAVIPDVRSAAILSS